MTINFGKYNFSVNVRNGLNRDVAIFVHSCRPFEPNHSPSSNSLDEGSLIEPSLGMKQADGNETNSRDNSDSTR